MYWVFPYYWNYQNAWNLLTKLFRKDKLKEIDERSEDAIDDFDRSDQTEVQTNINRYESDHRIWISKEEDPRLDPSRGGRDPTDSRLKLKFYSLTHERSIINESIKF